MTRVLIGLGLLSAFAVAGAVGHPDILADDIRTHVKFLASDACEGRLSLGPGALKASAYIADQYKKFGLKPKGADGTFFFPFDMSLGSAAGAGCELALSTGKKFALHKDYLPIAFGKQNARVKAQVVFIGYGIAAPDKGWDDYKDADVKGKIVLVFRGEPSTKAGDFGVETTTLGKARTAAEHGAVGILFAGGSRAGQSELIGVQGGIDADAAPIVGLSIRAAVADELLASTGKTLAQHRASIDQDKHSQQAVMAATVSIRSDVSRREGKARDVVGFLEGTDPTLKSEIIVFGGHYDHLGYGETGALDPGNTDIHYGADDNASGTAAVLELAEKLASEHKNKRSILFMAFAGEEEGLLGSVAYCRNPTIDLGKVTAMINCDMVGRMLKNNIVVAGVGTSPEFPDLLNRLNSDHLTLWFEKSGQGPSDHQSFYRKNVPVLFFFTGTHPDYHRHTDTWDKLNYFGEQTITRYVYRIAKAIDDDPNKVAFTESGGTMNVADQSSFVGPATQPDDNGEPRPARRVAIGFEPDYSDTAGTGLMLQGVRDGSPAQKAGIKGGDRVTKWNGQPVHDIEDLAAYMSKANPGTPVKITVLRGGKEIEMTVVPEAPGN